MKTYYEIIGEKNYRQLTVAEKEAIQARQTQLVIMYQDETDEFRKLEIFDELYDSVKGLIKGMAYKKARESYTVEQEDFEGLMWEELWKAILTFDRSLGKPFTPVFIQKVHNAIKMMYRQKSYDLHDTTYETHGQRLDNYVAEAEGATVGDLLETPNDFTASVEAELFTEQVLDELFGNDHKKRTIVHMVIQKHKRQDIVSTINVEGKSTSSVERLVNRTWNKFQEHCLNVI